jgi:hypothetical protein
VEIFMTTISPTTQRRLEIQGFTGVGDAAFGETARWLRLAFALCTALAIFGAALASPLILWSLVPIAIWAAVFPVHPFDYIYNYGLRHLTGTGPLPKRGLPVRFACGVGAIWLIATGWAFHVGAMVTGYVLGGMLAIVGLLVSTTDICIPSIIFGAMFGFPPKSAKER